MRETEVIKECIFYVYVEKNVWSTSIIKKINSKLLCKPPHIAIVITVVFKASVEETRE